MISGAFGVFKRQAVIDAGGYRTNTVGEDMDLVLRLHRLHRERRQRYRIVYTNDPVVWTEAPESLALLRRQRNRWQRGLLESLRAQRRMILNPRYGPVGLLAIPYNIVFEAIGPIIEVGGYAWFIIMALSGHVSGRFALVFFLLAVGYGCLISVLGVSLDQSMRGRGYHRARDVRRLLLMAIVENLGYRQLLAIWRAGATIDYLRKKARRGEMKRKGFGAP